MDGTFVLGMVRLCMHDVDTAHHHIGVCLAGDAVLANGPRWVLLLPGFTLVFGALILARRVLGAGGAFVAGYRWPHHGMAVFLAHQGQRVARVTAMLSQ